MTTTTAPTQRGDEGYDRTPPHDMTAEQCVLGGMMLSKDALGDVAEKLTAADFYVPAHGTVFDTICGLFADSHPADAVTVGAALAQAGQLTHIGNGRSEDRGLSYLHTLIHVVPTAANAGHYANIVADTALRRRVIEACTRGVHLGYGPGDATDIVDQAQQGIYDVTARRQGDDVSALGDMLQPTFDEVEALAKGGLTRGLLTGFADLDRLLNGLQPGQLIVVAGRPAQGKSTMGLDVARNVSIKQGLTSVIFSLEMSKLEIMVRLLSAEARVPLSNLRSGQLTDDDWVRMARRSAEISDAPLYVDDSPNLTLMEIRAKARRMCQRQDLKLVVVDYLQLMTSPTARAESRERELADLSRGLKLLAKELSVPVIAVAQLNRESEKRQDHRPQLSDLRGSGAIEQDADVVIMVHRDDYYDKESPRAGEADLIVAKQRNGPTDTVTVAAQLHFSRFVDMAIN